MMFSWLRCMNWVMPLVWSTPMIRQPSWLPFTSGWTLRPSDSPMTIAEAYSNFMVRFPQFSNHIIIQNRTLSLSAGRTFNSPVFEA